MATSGDVKPMTSSSTSSVETPAGGATSTSTGDSNSKPQTIQEMVASWTDESDGLTLGLFRIDPPKPFGQVMSYHISLVYRGISSEMPMQLTPQELGVYANSVLRTMSRLLSLKEPTWSRERRQFSHYTDLLVKIREGFVLLLYSYTGTLLSTPVFCRTVEEADEMWQRYQSGELEKELRELYSQIYLPFGPVTVNLKIYNYEECKRNFQFAGYRLLYILYPHIERRRYY